MGRRRGFITLPKRTFVASERRDCVLSVNVLVKEWRDFVTASASLGFGKSVVMALGDSGMSWVCLLIIWVI